jgi:hypothetical protein
MAVQAALKSLEAAEDAEIVRRIRQGIPVDGPKAEVSGFFNSIVKVSCDNGVLSRHTALFAEEVPLAPAAAAGADGAAAMPVPVPMPAPKAVEVVNADQEPIKEAKRADSDAMEIDDMRAAAAASAPADKAAALSADVAAQLAALSGASASMGGPAHGLHLTAGAGVFSFGAAQPMMAPAFSASAYRSRAAAAPAFGAGGLFGAAATRAAPAAAAAAAGGFSFLGSSFGAGRQPATAVAAAAAYYDDAEDECGGAGGLFGPDDDDDERYGVSAKATKAKSKPVMATSSKPAPAKAKATDFNAFVLLQVR